MSTMKIGQELLPNIYIKNIELYDATLSETSFRVTTNVYDFKNEEQKTWSISEMAKKINIVFVASADSNFNRDVSVGSVDFNIPRIRTYIQTKEAEKKIKLFSSKLIGSEQIDNEEETVFVNTYEFKLAHSEP